MSASAPTRGSAAIPQAASTIPPTPLADCDAALEALAGHKDAWVAMDINARIAVLRELVLGTEAVAEEWIAAACRAKGITRGEACEGEEWLAGPYTVMRNIRLLIGALEQIQTRGRPVAPGPVRTRSNGQLAVGVFPAEIWDKVLFQGFSAEIWLQEGPT
ncbi:MAG: hypothetical protein QF464_17730, partial [Myxococcota bacterium]|nr:hypothetical protein [Myxococcota bacterium]